MQIKAIIIRPFKYAIIQLFLLSLIIGNNAYAAASPHVSMISNGDFEEQFDENGIGASWYTWPSYNNDNGIKVSFQNDSHPKQGNGSQRVICRAYESGVVAFVNNTPIPIREGHDYTISLWMKGDVQSPVMVGIKNSSSTFMTKSFDVTAQWKHYEFTKQDITCTDDNCNARLSVLLTSTGSLSIDEANVYDLDQPIIDGPVYLDSNPDVGNDENDGKTPSTPWLTIKKIYEYDLLPGARILFKKGGQWQGPVIVSFHGTIDNPIYYGSYGEGERPVIQGAIQIDNWQRYNDGDSNTNIYVAENVTQPVKQLFVDGRRQTLARFPNQEDFGSITYNTITTACHEDSYDCLIDHENLRQHDPDYWVGADINIRTRAWKIEKAGITGFMPAENKITLDPDTKFNIREGHGYFIENKFEELDMPGEWFYHADEKKLYYWPPADVDILTTTIEASFEEHGFTSDTVENVVIEGFDIRNFTDAGIRFSNACNTRLSDNKIHKCGNYGIEIGRNWWSLSENIIIAENEIEDILNDGIVVQETKGCTIENNTIQFCKNRGILYYSNFDGVIGNNHISDSGYNGISMHATLLANNIIERNVIDRSCLLLDDGAGIYSSGDNGAENQIKRNIITNSVGNKEGLPSHGTQAQGIYLDEGAHDFFLTGNVVVNADIGIQIHNAHSHIIKKNIIYESRKAAVFLTHNGEGAEDRAVFGNVINDSNIFHSLGAKRTCVHLGTVFEGCTNCEIEGFAIFNDNYYAHPNIEFTFSRFYPGVSDFFSLEQWQAATSNDISSITFDGVQSEIFINSRKMPQTFDLDGMTYVTLENEPVGTSIQVDSLSARVLIRKELNCTDGLDNDGDDAVDSDDPDCPQSPDGLKRIFQ